MGLGYWVLLSYLRRGPLGGYMHTILDPGHEISLPLDPSHCCSSSTTRASEQVKITLLSLVERPQGSVNHRKYTRDLNSPMTRKIEAFLGSFNIHILL